MSIFINFNLYWDNQVKYGAAVEGVRPEEILPDGERHGEETEAEERQRQ